MTLLGKEAVVRVLLVHNYYQQRGGEDESFDSERGLLKAAGHEVVEYTRHNDEIKEMSSMLIATKAVWNRQSYADITALIEKHRPEVMHCTNVFPLISPSVYYAAQRKGVPVVQSLRNFRHFCLNSTLLRDEQSCTLCQKKFLAWPGVWHGCYRDSRAASAVVAFSFAVHRARGTWQSKVDLYFALSESQREQYVKAGYSPDQIAVKPGFVEPDSGMGSGPREFALYAGRLESSKGVHNLVQAWEGSSERLKLVGEGPLSQALQEQTSGTANIELLGRLPRQEVAILMKQARFIVVPSLAPEAFGRVVMESFSGGTPVICTDAGALPDLVEHGTTGFVYKAGCVEELRTCLETMNALSEERISQMRQAARREFEMRYTPEQNLELLLRIYRQALCRARKY